MGNVLSLALDVTIIIMLGITIYHAVKLSQRLTALRESRKEMDATIKQFFEASAKADLAIRNFQKTAKDTAQKLDGETSKAKLLMDELRLMIDTGNNLAARLEAVADQGKPSAKNSAMVAREPERSATGPAPAEPADDATAQRPRMVPAPVEAAGLPEPVGLEEGVAKRGEGRSKAEQELLKALQNMR